MDIGRQIHLVKASTVAPTLLDDPAGVRWCAPDSGYSVMMFNQVDGTGDGRCDCASACFLIWAGGVGREGDVLGVHRPYFDTKEFASLDAKDASDRYRVAEQTVRKYLTEMDIPEYIIRLMFANSSVKLRYLTKSEVEGISGLPPALEELKLARCGQRPSSQSNASEIVRTNYFNCAHRVYDEASRSGVRAYLEKYNNR